MNPQLVILSSPSGGGKTTIARTLLASRDDVGYSISATTRAPRLTERDGVDYYFLTPEAFEARVAVGEFLEWAEYSGERYGTLAAEVDRILGQGQHVILDIEVQGAAQIRQRRNDVVSIFVLPPSAQDLVERLSRRGAETSSEVARRLEQADAELAQAEAYDYVVVNDELERAVRAVGAIIDGKGKRRSLQKDLHKMVNRLRTDLRAARESLNNSTESKE